MRASIMLARNQEFAAPQTELADNDEVALLPPVSGGARADEALLRHILTNLLSNAIKFTPKNGTVTVSAKAGENGRIDIACADTGVGIAAAKAML